MLDFIKNISPTEWVIIAFIFVAIFGSKVLAKLGKTGGETIKEIKKIKKDFTKTVEDIC